MDILRSYFRIDSDTSFDALYMAKQAENNKGLFYVKAYADYNTDDGYYTTSIQRIVPITSTDSYVSPIDIYLLLNQPIDREDDIRDVHILNAVFSDVINTRLDRFELSPYPDPSHVNGIKINCYNNVSLSTFLDDPEACAYFVDPREREYRVKEFKKLTAIEDQDLDVFDFIKNLGASDFPKIIKQSYDYILENVRTVLHQEHWLIN